MESLRREQKLLQMNASVSWDGVRDCSKLSHFESKDYDGLDKLNKSQAFIELAKKWWPVILGMLLRKSIDFCNLIFTFRYSEIDKVSGLGLALIILELVSQTISTGVVGDFDKLYYNKAQVVLTVLYIPTAISIFFLSDIVDLIDIEDDILDYSEEFLVTFLPGLWLLWQIDLLRKFLIIHGEPTLLLKIQAVTHALHIPLAVLFMRFGAAGLAIATCITHTLTYGTACLYLSYHRNLIKNNSLFWINSATLINLNVYFKQCLLPALTSLFELWHVLLFVIISGLIGGKEQCAMIILMNIILCLRMIPEGIKLATLNLLKQNLTSKLPNKSRTFAIMSIVLCFVLSIPTIYCLLAFRHAIDVLMPHHHKLSEIIMPLYAFMMVYIICDFTSWIITGLLRLFGMQKQIIISYFICVWLIAGTSCIFIELFGRVDLAKIIIGKFLLILYASSYSFINFKFSDDNWTLNYNSFIIGNTF